VHRHVLGQQSLQRLEVTLPGGGERIYYEATRADGAHDLRTEPA